MDIADRVVEHIGSHPGLPLRSQREHGRYAHRVRVRAAHGSSWNGRAGIVAHVTEGTPFVRFPSGEVIPFGFADLQVLP